MKLEINHNSTVQQVQIDFNNCFPYLRIEFLTPGLHLADINKNISDCTIDLPGKTSVTDLENSFRVTTGLTVRVLRKSGNIWMETSFTSHWTLAQQNQHGKEISTHARI